MGVIVGIYDEIALRRLARTGVDDDVAESLIAACQHGFAEAMNEKGVVDDGQE